MTQNPNIHIDFLIDYIQNNIGNEIMIQFPKTEYSGKLIQLSSDQKFVTIKWPSRQQPETISIDRVVFQPSGSKRRRVPTSFFFDEGGRPADDRTKPSHDENEPPPPGKRLRVPTTFDKSETSTKKGPLPVDIQTDSTDLQLPRRRHRTPSASYHSGPLTSKSQPRANTNVHVIHGVHRQDDTEFKTKEKRLTNSKISCDTQEHVNGKQFEIKPRNRSIDRINKSHICPSTASFTRLSIPIQVVPDIMTSRSSHFIDFFFFISDLFILSQSHVIKNTVFVDRSIVEKLRLTSGSIYRELTESSLYFQQQVKIIEEIDMASSSTEFRSRDPPSEVRSTSSNALSEYKQPSSSLISNLLFASLCFRCIDSLPTFKEFGGIPRKDQWHSFHQFLTSEDRAIKFMSQNGATDENISYPMYISIMSGLLQNESEQLQQVVTKVQESSSEGNLKGCFDGVRSSSSSLTASIAWQVVCDLLEASVLGPCTEDSNIPYFHKYSVVALECLFGNDNRLSQIEQMKMLRDYQAPFFRKSAIQYGGAAMTLKNMERALHCYGMYIEEKNNSRNRGITSNK